MGHIPVNKSVLVILIKAAGKSLNFKEITDIIDKHATAFLWLQNCNLLHNVGVKRKKSPSFLSGDRNKHPQSGG